MTEESFAKKTKAVFYGMEFANGIRRTIFFTLILLYFISLGHDPIKVVAMFAAVRIIAALCEFPTGVFADYYSRKASIIISFITLGISFFGFFAFEDFWLLAIAYLIGEIGWTFQSGTTTAWAIDELKYGKEHKKITSLFARFFFFEKTGGIIGALIAAAIITIQFRYVWLFVGIITSISGIALIWAMTNHSQKKVKRNKNFLKGSFLQAKESLTFIFSKKNKQLRGLAFASILFVIAIDSFYLEMPLILSKVLGLSADKISGIVAAIGVLLLFAPFFAEAFAHKVGFRKSMFSLFLILAGAIAIFAISRNIVLSIFVLILFYFCGKAADVLYNSILQHKFSSKIRASLGSAMNSLWFLSNAAAAGFVSLGLATAGLVNTTILSSIFGFLAAIVYFIALKE